MHIQRIRKRKKIEKSLALSCHEKKIKRINFINLFAPRGCPLNVKRGKIHQYKFRELGYHVNDLFLRIPRVIDGHRFIDVIP